MNQKSMYKLCLYGEEQCKTTLSYAVMQEIMM
jgi:hypothetical protein